MEKPVLFAVVPSDLRLIARLRRLVEESSGVLKIARSSQEAILYLRGIGVYEDREHYPLPSVILLDSQSPDGADLDIIGWVRDQPEHQELPVVWLCPEHRADRRGFCALDPACSIVDRATLIGLPEAVAEMMVTPA